MSNPIRRTPGLNTETDGAELILNDAGKEVARLDGERAALWSICEGETDAKALAQRVGRQTGTPIDADRIFEILDEFADDGLIVARVTPPGTQPALGRRRFLSAALIGAGLVSAMTPVAMASNLANEEEKAKREAKHDARKNAQQAEKLEKQQERNAKHAAWRPLRRAAAGLARLLGFRLACLQHDNGAGAQACQANHAKRALRKTASFSFNSD